MSNLEVSSANNAEAKVVISRNLAKNKQKTSEPLFLNNEQTAEYNNLKKKEKTAKSLALYLPVFLGTAIGTVGAYRAKSFGKSLLGLMAPLVASCGVAAGSEYMVMDHFDKKKDEFEEKVRNSYVA